MTVVRRRHGARATPGWATRTALVVVAAAVLTTAGGSAQATPVATIKPGMTEAQVREAWGEPLTRRATGIMSYLYYRNDCLRRCGTYDIVFLERGQVIDAIVRDRHRKYDGISSSPVERRPEQTP